MAEFAKDGRLTHLPAPLQVIAEKAMSGEVQDRCDYEKVVEDFRALDADISVNFLQQMLDNQENVKIFDAFKYCRTILLMDMILAHGDNKRMLRIYNKIAETTDRHGRNILHLALIFTEFDCFDFCLENTDPDLLAKLILSKYMPRGLTVLHEVIEHGVEAEDQDGLLVKVLSKVSASQLGDYLLKDKPDPSSHLEGAHFLVFLMDFGNIWIKMVLDKLRDESDDVTLCERIILRPDCNLLEMSKLDEEYEDKNQDNNEDKNQDNNEGGNEGDKEGENKGDNGTEDINSITTEALFRRYLPHNNL